MALAKAIADQLGKQPKPRPVSLREAIPPLENGDRLTRAEFERRYNAMPPHIKAELIEGEVYLSSPVRYRGHDKSRRQMICWLVHYTAYTAGSDCVANTTFRLDEDNEPQPDVALFIEPEAGGQTRVSEDDILEAAPELIVEVTASTVSIDLHKKLNGYRRNGVQEYLVWRVQDAEFDWFVWESGQYVRLHPDVKGIIRSRLFPGLWLNIRALLKGEMKKVLTTLQQGLASKEHAAFVRKLKQQAKAKR